MTTYLAVARPGALDVHREGARIPWANPDLNVPVRPGANSNWRYFGQQPAGWALPGGARTTNRAVAEAVARAIAANGRAWPNRIPTTH